ncbi:hypothetical protein J2W42_002625 [Rhizobium tibeticum]|nr:hypothetical protein [Rhizobium tibeticum]
MRAVTRVESNLENVGRLIEQRPCRTAQAAGADIAADRMPGDKPEDARKVVARKPGNVRNLLQSDVVAE